MIFHKLSKRLIVWLHRLANNKGPSHKLRVGGHHVDTVDFIRFCPFWLDEWKCPERGWINKSPWWRPFNILLHYWFDDTAEGMHDHPRWSITVVLRGKLIEHTPWGDNVLTPGTVVFRSHKYIHGFTIPEETKRKTWTLFIVGRRRHLQNTYQVTRVE